MGIVQLQTNILTDERLHVDCSHTEFIRHTKKDFPSLKEVTALLSEVRSLCKAQNIQVRRAGYKKQLEDMKTAYQDDIEKYETLYQQLKEGFEDAIVDNTLEMGIDAPKHLHLRNLKFQLSPLFYRSAPLSVVVEIHRTLSELKDELSDPDSCTLVSVGL